MKKEFSSQRRDTSRANQQLAETDRNTVEPIVHTWEQKKVAVVERWPLCIGQIEASTCPPRATPRGHLTFLKIIVKIPPKMPFKCPTLGSIQVIKRPHPWDISQAQK